MNVISLYSGADNLGDGIIQAGHKVRLCVEMNSDACETIKLNHPDTEVICGKVSDYINSLPNCDAVVGGPPCPEFSRAKTNRTFDMCEVNHFWQAVDMTKAKYYFMENVQDIKKTLRKHSFLVNCADYGTPQTRIRRIYTNLPLPPPTHAKNPQTNLFGTQLKKWVSVKDALHIDGIMEDRKNVFERQYGDFRKQSTDDPAKTLTIDSRLFISVDGFKGCNAKEKTRSIDQPSHTILTSKNMLITNFKIFSRKEIESKDITYDTRAYFHEIDKPARTVATKDIGEYPSMMISDKKYCRKLTIPELAILQGFRKGFKFYGGKGSVRKQIGNALPAQVSRAFFEQVSL
jgi:site-specific DNA-cytosine methylase